MQADGRARQSMGPHGSLLRVGERLRESLQGAARRSTDIKEDISLGNSSGDAGSHVAEPERELLSDDPVEIHPPFLRTAHGDVTLARLYENL